MNIQRARELMGDGNTKYTDEQMQKIIDDLKILSKVVVDRLWEMTPDERMKYSKLLQH